MSYSDWEVGMKLVCIDNSDWEHKLEINAVYTMTAMGTGSGGYLYVGLKETPTGRPLQWRVHRFRPVTKRATDISIFTQLLISPKVPVDA